jgi:hypothetical protein
MIAPAFAGFYKDVMMIKRKNLNSKFAPNHFST